jgi:hypothetical protein
MREGLEKFGIDPGTFVMITAQVGCEYPDTVDLVQKHILWRLRKAGIRWVQVARTNPGSSEFVVLEDSRATRKVHFLGAYTLEMEMRAAGTIPQSGGGRKCSIKSKGNPIDAWVKSNIQGPYRHIMGYESEEKGRAFRDLALGFPNRIPEYPLIEWDWNRTKCEDYIESITGSRFAKSACFFCPFQAGSEVDEFIKRWYKYPKLAARALEMEFVARALNPTQVLFTPKAAEDFARDHGMKRAISAFETNIKRADSRLVLVRRIWKLRADGKYWVARSTRFLGRGSRRRMNNLMVEWARANKAKIHPGDDGIRRAWVKFRPAEGRQGVESFAVVVPSLMLVEKDGTPDFDAKYKKAQRGVFTW